MKTYQIEKHIVNYQEIKAYWNTVGCTEDDRMLVSLETKPYISTYDLFEITLEYQYFLKKTVDNQLLLNI